MRYKIVLKSEADDDLDELSHREKILVFKQFKKIASSPELGKLLGNKNGYDLSGCRKMYADQKRIRIVYSIIEDKIIIEVYKKASERL